MCAHSYFRKADSIYWVPLFSRGPQCRISRFLADESGASAIEYALIAALIALGIIVGATALGSAINQKFNDVATSLN